MAAERALLVERFLDGSISAADGAELTRLLEHDGQFRMELAQAMRMAGLVDSALRPTAEYERLGRTVTAAVSAPSDIGRFTSQVMRRLGTTRAAGAGESISRGTSARHRDSRRRSALPLPALVTAAAVLLAAIGAFVLLRGRDKGQPSGAAVAVAEGRAEVTRGDRRIDAAPGTPLLPGDRVKTDAGQMVGIAYAGEETRVRLEENSELDVLGAIGGKRLHLDVGKLAATVAPQHQGRSFAVTTPEARAEVFGTDFSLAVAGNETRLEVTKGLVAVTRLSDGKAVNVSAGQYAVAAEGVELAAAALPGGPSDGTAVPPSSSKGDRYGKVLFQDEFDGALENWDVVVGTNARDLAVAGDPASYARVERNFAGVWQCNEVLGSCVVLDTQHGPDRFAGIRLKRPVETEKFVVEMRSGFRAKRVPDQRRGVTWVWNYGIEARAEDIAAEIVGKSATFESAISMNMHRWEFTPAPEKGEGMLLCRAYGGLSKLDKAGKLAKVDYKLESSWHMRPLSRKVLLGICGPDWDLVIDRVTVRELLDDGPGTSVNRSGQ